MRSISIPRICPSCKNGLFPSIISRESSKHSKNAPMHCHYENWKSMRPKRIKRRDSPLHPASHPAAAYSSRRSLLVSQPHHWRAMHKALRSWECQSRVPTPCICTGQEGGKPPAPTDMAGELHTFLSRTARARARPWDASRQRSSPCHGCYHGKSSTDNSGNR